MLYIMISISYAVGIISLIYSLYAIVRYSQIKKDLNIQKVNTNVFGSHMDIMPTLYNLFGLEYDSRLIIGLRAHGSDLYFLKLNEKTSDLIYYAGLLQNVGKITLPEDLFNHGGKLTKEDWERLQNHPNVGVNLLMNINFLSEVIPYIHYHKERWDGRGEPEGLKGMSIPFGSRIIAVADAFSALTSDRSEKLI